MLATGDGQVTSVAGGEEPWDDISIRSYKCEDDIQPKRLGLLSQGILRL